MLDIPHEKHLMNLLVGSVSFHLMFLEEGTSFNIYQLEMGTLKDVAFPALLLSIGF